MNENLDLTEILEDCPKGTKLWHTCFGEVELSDMVNTIVYPICFQLSDGRMRAVTKDGKMFDKYDGECVLFPSKDQRDWSKFKAPNKKVKVTLHPFDKVLVRATIQYPWQAKLVTFITDEEIETIDGNIWDDVIPYNKDTAHLLKTRDKCPIDYEIEFSKEFKED